MITFNHKGNPIIIKCKNCDHYLEPKCFYIVKFPESSYSVSPGMKKEMRPEDGKNCGCFKIKKELLSS